jgi:hypothetical protein
VVSQSTKTSSSFNIEIEQNTSKSTTCSKGQDKTALKEQNQSQGLSFGDGTIIRSELQQSKKVKEMMKKLIERQEHRFARKV